MAPEVIQEKEYNQKCDIWSCGVLFFSLLSSQNPFTGQTKSEVLEQIKAGKIHYNRKN